MLTIYDHAPIEIGVKSFHALLEFFEFLVVDVESDTMPIISETFQ